MLDSRTLTPTNVCETKTIKYKYKFLDVTSHKFPDVKMIHNLFTAFVILGDENINMADSLSCPECRFVVEGNFVFCSSRS